MRIDTILQTCKDLLTDTKAVLSQKTLLLQMRFMWMLRFQILFGLNFVVAGCKSLHLLKYKVHLTDGVTNMFVGAFLHTKLFIVLNLVASRLQ